MSDHQFNYSLSTLFSGDRKIIVPDMQREYCWATTVSEHNGKDLVSNFITGLLQNVGSLTRLGLIYGYENPHNYLQLCDGQQRITTLYLLCGVLYRKLNPASSMRDILRNILISDAEINDDHEPRLQYAIRESTLFFLRDLVWNYFLGNGNAIGDGSENIVGQSWFFAEYKLDPSIMNMLKAIDIITSLTDNEKTDAFALYIAMMIQFYLFDMRDRKHGEEQFVVLNTTGKPLSVTENVKPLLLGTLSGDKLKHYSDMWEKWEQYFWENKPTEHQIADNGLNEFFRWIFIIEDSGKNPPKSAESNNFTMAQKALGQFFFDLCELCDTPEELMERIDQYFSTLRRLTENNAIKGRFLFQKLRLEQIDCFQFLPVFQYALRFPELDVNGREITRLMNFLETRAMDADIRKTTVLSVFHALGMIRGLYQNHQPDIAQVIHLPMEISVILLDGEERFKFSQFLRSDNREVLEDAVWAAERLQFCRGTIGSLLQAMDIDINAKDSILKLDKLLHLTQMIRASLETPNDLMRRALLARGDYTSWDGTTAVLGANRYSLGKDAKFFGEKAKEDKIIQAFMKELLLLPLNSLSEFFQTQINDFKPSPIESAWEKARAVLINDPENMSKMGEKLFSITYDETKVYGLTQQKVTSENTFFLLAEAPPQTETQNHESLGEQ